MEFSYSRDSRLWQVEMFRVTGTWIDIIQEFKYIWTWPRMSDILFIERELTQCVAFVACPAYVLSAKHEKYATMWKFIKHFCTFSREKKKNRIKLITLIFISNQLSIPQSFYTWSFTYFIIKLIILIHFKTKTIRVQSVVLCSCQSVRIYKNPLINWFLETIKCWNMKCVGEVQTRQFFAGET
jgi:hypothetical protein